MKYKILFVLILIILIILTILMFLILQELKDANGYLKYIFSYQGVSEISLIRIGEIIGEINGKIK